MKTIVLVIKYWSLNDYIINNCKVTPIQMART